MCAHLGKLVFSAFGVRLLNGLVSAETKLRYVCNQKQFFFLKQTEKAQAARSFCKHVVDILKWMVSMSPGGQGGGSGSRGAGKYQLNT